MVDNNPKGEKMLRTSPYTEKNQYFEELKEHTYKNVLKGKWVCLKDGYTEEKNGTRYYNSSEWCGHIHNSIETADRCQDGKSLPKLFIQDLHYRNETRDKIYYREYLFPIGEDGMIWTHAQKVRDHNKYSNKDIRIAEEYLERLRKRDIHCNYNTRWSSVEQGIFLSGVVDAINTAKPKDEKELMAKAHEIVANTPYTNWSGD